MKDHALGRIQHTLFVSSFVQCRRQKSRGRKFSTCRMVMPIRLGTFSFIREHRQTDWALWHSQQNARGSFRSSSFRFIPSTPCVAWSTGIIASLSLMPPLAAFPLTDRLSSSWKVLTMSPETCRQFRSLSSPMLLCRTIVSSTAGKPEVWLPGSGGMASSRLRV